MLHPIVLKALAYGRPDDWHQLVLEYPHIPEAGDRAKVAYTRDERSGEANRQTVTSLGKYLTRHFPVLPDHTIRDLVALAAPSACKLVHTMAEMLFHIVRGPGSCMAKEFGGPESHPYNVYNPERGWHMAVREEGGDTVGRALCMDDGKIKYFVRSYRKTDNYSPSDEALETWLREQGYEKHSDWEGCTLDYIPGRYGEFLAPYLDGDIKGVDVYTVGATRHLRITNGGEYECNNTDGTPSGGGEECNDCNERVREGDGYWVGRHEDTRVCDSCIDNYRYAYGYRGRQYYVYEDNTVYVDSQGEYYATDHLDDNNIVELDDGEYEHTDNTVYLSYRGVHLHIQDTLSYVELPNGDNEHIDDCVELADGDWCLRDDAWLCTEFSEWYSTDVEPVEIDGCLYHPDSDTAQEHIKRGSHEHQTKLALEAA